MRLAVLPVLCFALVCPGQEPPAVFRAGTRLVEVTVTVLDKKGQAVTGLGPSDFTILDVGKSRPVAFFRFEGTVETRRATPVLPPGIFTNNIELTGGPPRNITALVLDGLNTPAQYNIAARAQMMRFLKALAPETRVAIFHMGQQLRVLHDFTGDAAALRARLEKVMLGMPLESVTDFSNSIIEAEQFVDMFSGDPAMQAAMEEMMRNQLEVEAMANAAARRSRMERSLAAMEALGQHLSGIPGRKNLVWITGGFSMVSITGAMGMGPRGSVDNFEDKVRKTSQRLAQQGITLYIVDAHGLETQPGSSAAYRAPLPVRGRGRFEPQMDAEQISNDALPAMSLMATITGGRYLYNTNDLAAGFKQAISDMRGSYTLGFYAPEEADNKWHKLKVRVARPGVMVKHREGYLAEPAVPHPADWTPEMWRAAIANPLGSSNLQMTVQCEAAPTGEVTLALRVSSANLHFRLDGDSLRADVEILIADRAADGRAWTKINGITAKVPVAQAQQLRGTVIPYRQTWKPDAAVTTIRIIARDKFTGRYGSLDVPMSKIQQVDK